VRQAYLNGLIPSNQRATVLSFDSLIGSSGGVVIQPVLGKVADVWNYPFSYIVSAGFQIMSLPFILLARREKASSDPIEKEKKV
jgi:MFS family permease